MGKKKDYLLEYVYHKKQFKKSMWRFLFMWITLRTIHIILYLAIGKAYLTSWVAIFLFWASGLVFGLAIMTLIIYRRSIRINDPEDMDSDDNK